MQGKHIHNYDELVLINVIADNDDYLGDIMGILAWKCSCGDKKAFEYGPRRSMIDLGEEIKAKKVHA